MAAVAVAIGAAAALGGALADGPAWRMTVMVGERRAQGLGGVGSEAEAAGVTGFRVWGS